MINAKEVPRHKRMTVDEVLSFSFKSAMKEFSALSLWILMCLLVFSVNIGLVFLWVKAVDSGGTLPIWAVSESRFVDTLTNNWVLYGVMGLLLILLDIYFALFSSAYFFRLGVDHRDGKKRSASERLSLAFSESVKLLPAYLLYFVISLGVMTPYLLVAGVDVFMGKTGESGLSVILNLLGSIVSMVIAVRFFCWYIIILVEDSKTIAALRKTFDMTGGRFFRILGYSILISLILGLIGLVAVIPFIILWVFIAASDFQMAFVSIGLFLSVVGYAVLIAFSAAINANSQVAVYYALNRENEPDLPVEQAKTLETPQTEASTETMKSPDDFQI